MHNYLNSSIRIKNPEHNPICTELKRKKKIHAWWASRGMMPCRYWRDRSVPDGSTGYASVVSTA